MFFNFISSDIFSAITSTTDIKHTNVPTTIGVWIFQVQLPQGIVSHKRILAYMYSSHISILINVKKRITHDNLSSRSLYFLFSIWTRCDVRALSSTNHKLKAKNHLFIFIRDMKQNCPVCIGFKITWFKTKYCENSCRDIIYGYEYIYVRVFIDICSQYFL